MSHPQDWTLRAQAEALHKGELSASALLVATLDRLHTRDPELNSTPVIFDEESRAALAQAPAGTLHGVPLTVKDMFALPWRGARNGTNFELIPASASGPYRHLRDAGAIVVGVANQHELGMGSTGTASAYGVMKNPWNLDRCAGGSSGGSAAGVAARLVAGSLGSDSGGSTRIPASYCGVVGLKVTYGAVPYDGYFGSSTTFSAPGLLARDGGDTRILASALLQRPLSPQSGSGLRIGIVRDPYWDDADPEVAEACERAMRDAGWHVSAVRLENSELATAAYLGRIVAEVGLLSNELLASLSNATRALVLAGMLSPARFVPRADRVRSAIRDSLARMLQAVDFVAWPSTPTCAPPLNEPWVTLPSGRASADVSNIRQSCLVNLSGVPSISVPVGFNSSGLPIGLQLIAPWGNESRLLDAAEHIERSSDRQYVDLAPTVAL
jgi:aspartyl-tRNA(Asn)/glutamyl-tRNA(Gln) amidotransferase subunit A